jgi:TonB-linked SusC/RagA family outer membrane protein
VKNIFNQHKPLKMKNLNVSNSKKWWLLFLLVTVGWSITAQVTVTGRVTDEQGEPLTGVNIAVKNTTTGTFTDIDGSYSLEIADPNATLIFSYTGYSDVEMLLQGKTNLDMVMREQAELLNEVVVIGYGTVRKSDLTGSVGTVKSEELQKVATSNAMQALQGKVAGVQVTAASGRPGDAPVVRIRGTGTLNGAAPIYVVDGLIVTDIGFLTSADIERMEVLKDASAAAIYGARGANGVIMITTRKGVRSQRAKFSLNTYIGQQRLAGKIDLANATEYAQLSNEIALNSNATPPYADPAAFGEGTDWQDEIFRTGLMQSINLNVSGGSESMLYSISGDVFRQEGIVKSSYFNRYSLRVNNEYNFLSWLKFGHNVALSFCDQNGEPGGIVFNAIAADPTAPPIDSMGRYGNTSVNSNVSNPVAQLEYNSFNRAYGQLLTGNAFAEIYPLKNLTLRSSLGFILGNDRSKSFVPEFEVNDKQRNPESILNVGFSRGRDWQWENTASYSRDWTNHRISLLAGYTAQEQSSEWFGGSRKNLISDDEDFYYLSSGDVETATNYNDASDPARYVSWLFRTNYIFREKYLLTASFRRDGSSRFGSEKRFGNFPSVAVAWRIIEEGFMDDQGVFSNLKFRASWGLLGNDKIPTDAAVPKVTSNLNAVFGPKESFLFGATLISLANPYLQWEEATSSNAGFEMGFLNNRLTAEIDFYFRKTKKVLVPVPIPDYVGSAGDPYVNAADVTNSGLDWNLNWANSAGKFSYRIGFNGSTIRNEVNALGSSEREAIEDVLINGEFATRTEVGQPIGAFYGYKIAGVYQNQADIEAHPNSQLVKPGDLRFVNINGDSIIDTKDRTYLGSSIPKLVYGFSFGFDWSGFDFSIDFNGVAGNKLFNAKKTARGFGIPNFEASFLDRWTGAGTNASNPRTTNGGYPNFSVSERFIESGAYLRLRSMQIGYSLPKSWVSKVRMSNLRLYLSANNLATWTDYTGYSPEISSENVYQVGIDRGVYPIARTFTFGLNAGF